MRTTINIDDKLIARAMHYSGSKERATVVRLALEEFVQRQAELRLAKLKGSIPDFGGGTPARRRRPQPE